MNDVGYLKLNEYKHLENGTTVIFCPYRNGEIISACIDTDDFERVMNFPGGGDRWVAWTKTSEPQIKKGGMQIGTTKKHDDHYLLHRFIMGLDVGERKFVFARNQNFTDCRKQNLICSNGRKSAEMALESNRRTNTTPIIKQTDTGQINDVAGRIFQPTIFDMEKEKEPPIGDPNISKFYEIQQVMKQMSSNAQSMVAAMNGDDLFLLKSMCLSEILKGLPEL